jgi:hypothetical protein
MITQTPEFCTGAMARRRTRSSTRRGRALTLAGGTRFSPDSDCTDVPLHWTKTNAACVAYGSGWFKITFTGGGVASDAQHTRAKLGLSAVAILSMLYAFV